MKILIKNKKMSFVVLAYYVDSKKINELHFVSEQPH